MRTVWMMGVGCCLALAACVHTGDGEDAAVAPPSSAAATAIAEAAPAFAPEVIEVAPGVSMLMGRGGNIGLLSGEDGAFVIDDQFPDIASGNLAAIERIAGGGPRYLVNTHWHSDHAGGNVAFAGAGATIIAHENVRKRLTGEVATDGMAANMVQKDPAAWPVVTIADGVTFHLNGQTIEVSKVVSAHTDGDSFVYFKEADVLHMGDVFFNGAYPVIDLGSGGSVVGYMAAQHRGLELAGPNTKIIPGHGPLGTKADLEAEHEMIEQTIAAVQAEVKAGKTLEQTLADRPLAKWSEKYGKGFMNEEAYTTVLYTGLSQ